MARQPGRLGSRGWLGHGSYCGAQRGSPADPWLGDNFHGDSNLGTAISTSGGSGGDINLGDGQPCSW
jgi:hypothetical protein